MIPHNSLELLQQLRTLGVSKFAGALPGEANPISVEFFPLEKPMPTGPALPPDFGQAPTCACGHLKDSEHSNKGLCYHGCPVSLCHPTSTANPESAAVTG